MIISMCVVQDGLSCLHMAICGGHVDIVKELLASAACELTRVEVSVLRARQCVHTSLHVNMHASSSV